MRWTVPIHNLFAIMSSDGIQYHRQAVVPVAPLHVGCTPSCAPSDGTPITWMDDNDAHIEGILHEVGKFFKRTGRFQYF